MSGDVEYIRLLRLIIALFDANENTAWRGEPVGLFNDNALIIMV